MNYLNVYANQTSNKYKLIKVDSLYRKLCNLYLAMSLNHEYSEILLTNKNQKMKNTLIAYIKSISSFDNLKESFKELKNSSEIIRQRIDGKFSNKLNKQ